MVESCQFCSEGTNACWFGDHEQTVRYILQSEEKFDLSHETLLVCSIITIDNGPLIGRNGFSTYAFGKGNRSIGEGRGRENWRS